MDAFLGCINNYDTDNYLASISAIAKRRFVSVDGVIFSTRARALRTAIQFASPRSIRTAKLHKQSQDGPEHAIRTDVGNNVVVVVDVVDIVVVVVVVSD